MTPKTNVTALREQGGHKDAKGPVTNLSIQRTNDIAFRRPISTWSELLGALCSSQAHHADLTHEEYGALVRRRGAEWHTAVGQRRQVSNDRRERVLAYPDLAAELQRLLGLPSASDWTGYVPPQLDATGQLNTSRVRAALVRICAEALSRERADRSASA